MERRSQVRGLMALWNKCDFRFEDLLRLRHLRLSNRALTDDDVTALCAVLDDKMVQVSELDLLGNRLRDASLVALASALQRGAIPYLTCLHVDRNRMGDEGLKALVGAISGGALPRLHELFLNNNLFGTQGVVALAGMLGRGCLADLICLGLSGNEGVRDKGLEALAVAATESMPDREDAEGLPIYDDRKCMPNLKELHLRGVGAGDLGLNAIANAIEPRTGGFPALRSLFVDEEHLKQPALKTACSNKGMRLDFF